MNKRRYEIIKFIQEHQPIGNKEILSHLLQCGYAIARPTLSRDLVDLLSEQHIQKDGAGRSVTYRIPVSHPLLQPIDTKEYFVSLRPDRFRLFQFQPSIIQEMHGLFSDDEHAVLDDVERKALHYFQQDSQELQQQKRARMQQQSAVQIAQICAPLHHQVRPEYLYALQQCIRNTADKSELLFCASTDWLVELYQPLLFGLETDNTKFRRSKQSKKGRSVAAAALEKADIHKKQIRQQPQQANRNDTKGQLSLLGILGQDHLDTEDHTESLTMQKPAANDTSILTIQSIHSAKKQKDTAAQYSHPFRTTISGFPASFYCPPQGDDLRKLVTATITQMNQVENVFEKVFIWMVCLSALQPFEQYSSEFVFATTSALLFAHVSVPLFCPILIIEESPEEWFVEYIQASICFVEQQTLLPMKQLFFSMIQKNSNALEQLLR